MFGANGSVYQEPGDWQLSLTSRNLVSNDHYNGKVEQLERQRVQSFVNNTQNLLDVGISRVLSKRVSVSIGIPFVNSTWALRDPAFPFPQERQEIPQNGKGLGDISVSGRSWILNPDTHQGWNFALGAGLKLPTGNSRYQDTFIGRFDRVEKLRYVDQSVQPGDGGWGLMTEGHAFWRVKKLFLFASGSYLANPKDTNGTPSIITVLEIPLTGNFVGLGENSVPDQYMARLGGTVPVWKGFSASLAWRLEGLKRYDLFGDSHGWRRPGNEMFVEPGFSYAAGPHSVSFNVPIGYFYNRHANPYTGAPGDATFPRHIFVSSYSFRLGKKSATPGVTDQPSTTPSSPTPTPGAGAGVPSSTPGPIAASIGQQAGLFNTRAPICYFPIAK